MQVFECVLFDTEFTAWVGSKQRNWSKSWEQRELIQLAAVKLSVSASSVSILASFNELIKPTINPQLSDYITNLTGIEQNMIDELGVDFASALTQFHHFCGQGKLPVYSWGNDLSVLQQNCKLYAVELPEFQQGFHNLQFIARKLGLAGFEQSSGALANFHGLSLQGHIHNALYDVRSVAATLNMWINKRALTIENLLFAEGR
ncbi:3'-5' exonuclease [Aliiglaciecola sp. 2_MG-2023]|uniref:3'-5' exonuclease n=1 Tax=unclassified Aliiglaciecola TaxID=2593648 RepID=UPI0026E3C6F0|nr:MULTISPECIES: 3'-5' exonuclease [unclassified Aliiglaciecola]MDO6711131.1 3'-5' exonuclease [Aliiglaciecola sp. 2_MG-2023]MDO6752045.1 3'-5' exonuclease [Aliiglaciecola sp. 1_MG-2023]